MDTYDLASEARDREINFILTDRDRGKLQAIEDALERVEEGSYGICESLRVGDSRGPTSGDAVHASVRTSVRRIARSRRSRIGAVKTTGIPPAQYDRSRRKKNSHLTRRC